MHIRVFNVAQDVPIGNVEIDKDQPHTGDSVEVDVPPEEASRFDLWLRGLWQDKDGQLTRYYANGGTFATKGNPSVVIPLRLRHGLKTTISFCIILPIILGYFMALFRR